MLSSREKQTINESKKNKELELCVTLETGNNGEKLHREGIRKQTNKQRNKKRKKKKRQITSCLRRWVLI